jgi:hypothetical protein
MENYGPLKEMRHVLNFSETPLIFYIHKYRNTLHLIRKVRTPVADSLGLYAYLQT